MKGWNQSLYKVAACATLLLGLASCSGGDGGGGGGAPPAASPTTGTFVDSPVDGLHFTSPPSNPAGGFTSGGGHFQCQSGDNVTFDLGGKVIGNPQPCSSNVVTAVSVFGASIITDNRVVNLTRLLLTIVGGAPNANNVIQLPSTLPPLPLLDFSPPTTAFATTLLPTVLVPEATATTHLAASFKTLSVMIVNGGTVTSNPAGINCTAGTCSYAFVTDTVVTLTATGSGFIGWTGVSCSGTGTCVLTLNADAAVTATFTPTVIVSTGLFTYHNDNLRTGQNLNESVLTLANVNTTKFGLLFSIPVDGYIYAQPLYVANLDVGGQIRNVVFVATEHDSVYAFDADNSTSIPLWHTSFINPPGVTTVSSIDVSCGDLVPEIGITSTPVIDPNKNILYVVSKTKENGAYVQRVHALDITTGLDKIPPMAIQAAVPGTGSASVNGMISFDPFLAHQRAALLLSDGVLYIAFASHCDNGPYHGWVFAYDALTLNQLAVFNATPNGGEGGIWQSGGGLSADGNGNVILMTGNGTFDGRSSAGGNNNFGDSFLKLTKRTLTVSDFFTPFNQAALAAADADLGSGAPLLLPDQPGGSPHLMVSAGKEGTIYLVNRDSMGGFQAGSDSQIVQSLPGALGSLFSTPAYFQNTVYFLASGDFLKAFTLSSGQLGTSPASQATTFFGFPGATPVISANGASNGIVWALQTDQAGSKGPAVLHAYPAANVSTELYNSNQNLSRDNPGSAVKFTVPTVFNGKVYVGSQTRLSIFGLFP